MQPDSSSDRIIQSFDGYNSYLLIVDEHTRFVWVFLCKSNEPLLNLIHLHLTFLEANLAGPYDVTRAVNWLAAMISSTK
jgi:hypothetical protein